MKIEEAIVYILASSRRGMTTTQIADSINEQRLHQRRDGRPVSCAQVYAVVCHNPEIFAKDGGLIRLLM